jgi:serine/threonine protein kinase
MPASDPQRETLLSTIEGQPLVGGRFENIRRLGQDGGDGSFSLMLSGDDRVSGKRVALKFFHPQQMMDQYRWDCFQRESHILERFLGMPDILQRVAPRDQFSIPFSHQGMSLSIPFAYYAAELAETDVNQIILADEWSPRQKLEGFRAMCRAVQRIHNWVIAHRDIKPSNFLIMADGSVRLADFGTARDLHDPHGSVKNNYQAPVGDRRYCAPEVLATLHDVDPMFAFGADVYSLGAVLFELFAGTPLNLQVFDWSMIADLQRTMNSVERTSRVRTYNNFVGAMASGHPPPNIGQFGGVVPHAILSLLNELYSAMAAIDYRRRLRSFDGIFSSINRCIWILDHEAAWQRWRQLRLRAKQAREEKERLRSERLTQKIGVLNV